MNYYQPAQIEKGPNAGKWHYVSINRRNGTHPVGYCADGCPGHDSEDEARSHYRDYLLDSLSFVDGPSDPDTLYRCEFDGCKERTAGVAETGPGKLLVWFLCAEHRNRESVAHLMPEVGDSASSY